MAKPGEYVVKVNTFGRNSDVKLPWAGVRKLSELEVETWFEETRRVGDMRRQQEAGAGGVYGSIRLSVLDFARTYTISFSIPGTFFMVVLLGLVDRKQAQTKVF